MDNNLTAWIALVTAADANGTLPPCPATIPGALPPPSQTVTASAPDGDGMVTLTPGTSNPDYAGQRVCLRSTADLLPVGSREHAIVVLNCDRRESELTATFAGQSIFHNTAYDVKRSIVGNPNSDWTIDSAKQLPNNVVVPSHAALPAQGKAWIDLMPRLQAVATSNPVGGEAPNKAAEERMAALRAKKAAEHK